MPENGWGEWSKHVLKELERLNDCYGGLQKEVQKVRIEIAMLKVKSGIWGGLAGLIPVVLFIAYQLMKGMPKG